MTTSINLDEIHPAPPDMRLDFDSINYENVSVIRAADRPKEITYVGETREQWLENIGVDSVGILAVCYAQWVYEELNKQSGVSITAHQVEQMVLHARKWMNVEANVVSVNEGALVDATTREGPTASALADEAGWDTLDEVTDSDSDSGEPTEPLLDGEPVTQEEALRQTR